MVECNSQPARQAGTSRQRNVLQLHSQPLHARDEVEVYVMARRNPWILFAILFQSSGCLSKPCERAGPLIRTYLECEESPTTAKTADTSSPSDSSAMDTSVRDTNSGDTSQTSTADTSQDTGLPVVVDPTEMVSLQGGTFEMGQDNPAFDSDYEPVHTVTLSPFMIMKAPVTRQLYDQLTNDPAPQCDTCPTCPATYVTWFEAVEFANILSAQVGLDSVYTITPGNPPTVDADWTANGYRLATEAEWEYAARGGETFFYAGSNNAYEVGWFAGDSVTCPQPVCSKTVNGFGLCDMSGNTDDWLWDWWGEEYYSNSPGVDPRGPNSGVSRSTRGGGFNDAPLHLYVREKNRPDSNSLYGSIRLVRRIGN